MRLLFPYKTKETFRITYYIHYIIYILLIVNISHPWICAFLHTSDPRILRFGISRAFTSWHSVISKESEYEFHGNQSVRRWARRPTFCRGSKSAPTFTTFTIAISRLILVHSKVTTGNRQLTRRWLFRRLNDTASTARVCRGAKRSGANTCASRRLISDNLSKADFERWQEIRVYSLWEHVSRLYL